MITILGTAELGISVIGALLQSNPTEEISLVNTNGRMDMKLPENVKTIAADLTDKHIMKNIARKSDTIFSCINASSPESITHLGRIASALEYALAHSTAKLVFADNLRSYGNLSGRLMHEGLPHKAQTREGLIRASLISTLLLSGSEFNDRVAIVKAADLVGPGINNRTFGIDFLYKLYRGRLIVFYGSIQLPHAFTFIDDFAKAMVNVGSAADTFGEIWHVPNAPAMGIDKWIHLFEVSAGRKAKLVMLPTAFMQAASVFSKAMRESYEFVYEFQYPFLVDNSKFISRFGSDVTYPSSIVKQTVKWYGQKIKQDENL